MTSRSTEYVVAYSPRTKCKATVDQIARRLGVHASTVEGWRQDALDGMAEALRRGNGRTPRELELEKKADQLEKVVTKLSIQSNRCSGPVLG